MAKNFSYRKYKEVLDECKEPYTRRGANFCKYLLIFPFCFNVYLIFSFFVDLSSLFIYGVLLMT